MPPCYNKGNVTALRHYHYNKDLVFVKEGFSERYALAVRIALAAFHLAEGEM